MAGIGFVLRKLMQKRDLTGVFGAYFHASLVSSGPWLFTVIALGSFFFIFKNWPILEDIENFRIIILYNFSFSLVIASPISILATRYLADSLYKKDVSETAGMLIGAMTILFLIGIPVASLFYLGYAKFSWSLSFMAIFNFQIIMGIWLLSVFISAVRYYKAVTFSFIFGLAIAIIAASYLGVILGSFGMLLGFTIGLMFILASLIALVFTEYPKECRNLFKFLSYTSSYWDLALGGLAYNIAIWVDKWIMWFAPEAEVLPNRLLMYPTYDAPMFAAYLTIVPGMAMFVITQETAFYEVYVRYYRSIQEHGSLKKILTEYEALKDCVFYRGRNLLLLQCFICILTLLLAPQIFQWTGMNLMQLGIFRFGVLGSTFQILTVFLAILLSYFDYRKGALWIQLVFLSTNTIFTIISMKLGFAFYGYGYFLSTLVSFLFAAILAERYLQKLPYHTFVTTNTSVQN